MTRVLMLFAIILLLFNCKENVKQEPHVKYSHDKYLARLIETGQKIEIALDQFTVPVTNCLDLKGDTLAFLRDSSILLMDIKKRTMLSSINLSEVSKHGLDKVYSFLFVNLDSIFLITSDPRYILLIDSNGNIKDKLPVVGVDERFYPSCSASAGGTKMIFQNNKLYFNITSLFLEPDDIKEQFEQVGPTMTFDLVTRKLERLPFMGKDKHNWSFGNEPYPSVTCDGSKLIYSFLSNHSLYTFHGDQTSKMDASSDFFHGFIEEIGDDNTKNFKKYLTKIINGDEYIFITYDPYRKVYYRFVYLGLKPGKNDNLKKLAYMRPQFSIIILDKDLKKIGETRMPDRRHVAFNHFVTQEGLYLSNNHFQNKKSNEDTLSFSLYQLEKNTAH